MPPLVIHYSGTTPEQISQEAKSFFTKYTTWQGWLCRDRERPNPLDFDMAILTFFMTWLEAFLQGDPECSVNKSWLATRSQEYGVQAVLMWIWMHLETVPEEKIEQALVAAAEVFQERRGHSAVFHPKLLMVEAGDLYCAADKALLAFMPAEPVARYQATMG